MTRMGIGAAAIALAGISLTAAMAMAAEPSASLKQGKPDLKSAGPLAFGPEGILFVGDTQGAALFAIDTGEKAAKATEKRKLQVKTWPVRSPACSGPMPSRSRSTTWRSILSRAPRMSRWLADVDPKRSPSSSGSTATGSLRSWPWTTSGSPRPRSPTHRLPVPSPRRGSAKLDDHRPGLCGRSRLPGGPVQRGILVPIDRDPVPVQQ